MSAQPSHADTTATSTPNAQANDTSPELNDTQLDAVAGGFGGGIESAQLSLKDDLQGAKKIKGRLFGSIADTPI